MGKRRSGRELAFRLLFQCDVANASLEEVLTNARIMSEASDEVWAFAEELARGAWSQRHEADEIITKYSAGWTLDRMPNADRNLLRLAIHEISQRPEIPQSVSINESVELAKQYSTQDSGKFINGILGSYVRERSQ